MAKWSAWAGSKGEAPRLVYGGDRPATHRGVKVLPWRDIESLAAAVWKTATTG